MDKRCKIGAMALLVHLSPLTGEPVAMRVNNRRSQIGALNATYEVEDPVSKKMVPFVFTKELRADRFSNGHPIVGDKSLHYFICSPEWTKMTEKDMLPSEPVDSQLQTWVPLRLRPEKDSENVPTSSFNLFIADQKLTKFIATDLDILHYVLNVKKILPNCSVTTKKGKGLESIMVCQWAFEALNEIPLHNATLMRKHITNVLGIPLWDDVDKDEVIPIHRQWTLLSYFLQMCCPICVSPIEGGHRTWEFIKFYTGANFDDFTPQKVAESSAAIKPSVWVNEEGLSQASYNFYAWQPLSVWKSINIPLAKQLQKKSSTIRKLQLMQCDDTYGEFFDLVILDVNDIFKNLTEDELLTQSSFFMDFKKGLEEINRRVPVISQIVFRRIKNKEPMKAKWNNWMLISRSIIQAMKAFPL